MSVDEALDLKAWRMPDEIDGAHEMDAADASGVSASARVRRAENACMVGGGDLAGGGIGSARARFG